jgi:hypothetical protein
MSVIGSIFGPTEHEESVAETSRLGLRAEIFKKIALGGSWSIGAAIVYGVIEFLRSDPRDAFPMLRSWGPWAIFSLCALFVGYDLIKGALNIGQRLVLAIERLATAQQKSADKDDRQMQEMQTLTAYTAQQSERTHEMLRTISEKLDTMSEAKRA